MKDQLAKPLELKVDGMHCTNCALGIKKALEKEGFQEVMVDFTLGEVKFNSKKENGLVVAVEKIESLGYSVKFDLRVEDGSKNGLGPLEKKFWLTAILTLPLVLAMFIPVKLLHNDIFQLVLATPVFLIGMKHFGTSAFNSLRAGVANMDVLIFLGSTAAYVYSLIGTINSMGHDYMFYETSAAIITIVLLGNMLEQRAVRKTTGAVNDLVQLQRNTAKRIIKNGLLESVEEVDASLVQSGEIVLINQGDRIPVDGEIIWGHGSVDESMITGESLPMEKSHGNNVIGGTALLTGSIKVVTTATGDQTVLSQIIELVRKAQREKPHLQNLADRISAIFVPVVVTISILSMAGWFLIGDLPFKDSLLRGIAVLLIACPCALGLAIPTAVMVGLGRMAKAGILIKGGTTFDKLAQVKTIVFDKTGTLTSGNFAVKGFETFGISEKEAADIIHNIEKHSSHPVAKALTKHFIANTQMDFASIEEEKGIGVVATTFDGKTFRIGSYSIASHVTRDDSHNVYLLVNGKLAGWIDIEDEIRPGAGEIIRYLNQKDIKTILLSGDSPNRCHEVAQNLNLNEVHGGMLPGQKLEMISALSLQGRVAMVGDGINDAPALARADVGISLSNSTQVAVNSADVVLMRENLLLIKNVLTTAKATINTMKENLFWAFAYNVAAIPLAIAGYLTPMVAAGAMALSSIIVVMNSIRLKRRKIS
jgi:Cu+-exporting ATPase